MKKIQMSSSQSNSSFHYYYYRSSSPWVLQLHRRHSNFILSEHKELSQPNSLTCCMCYSLQLVLLFIFGLYFVYHIYFLLEAWKRHRKKRKLLHGMTARHQWSWASKAAFFFPFFCRRRCRLLCCRFCLLPCGASQPARRQYCAQWRKDDGKL